MQQRSQRNDDMEIRGPLGWSLRASGKTVVTVIFAAIILASVVWHDWKSTQQNMAMVQELQNIAYVMTLSDVERKALNLTMPEGLRARIAANPGMPGDGNGLRLPGR